MMRFAGITDKKLQDLKVRMRTIKVYEKDLAERFIHSSGKGGQNVNKVATCVFLQHVPSGLSVKCQKERTQALNRYLARVRLLAKIERAQELKVQKRKQLLAKQRRRNRKRSKKSKERVLDNKRVHSQKKESRRKVNIQKLDKFL